ncbi:uncharacterized protein LOC131203508 [Ahaetulla prasina]|uniref:uncharacterized protein LOC131203508 n=1 Tax=Ahaetulla prasina TaxID=499056 RepID=UPI00264909AD|nr:uncharacterized protein LOC131203508 [Ahaetulla prasina]
MPVFERLFAVPAEKRKEGGNSLAFPSADPGMKLPARGDSARSGMDAPGPLLLPPPPGFPSLSREEAQAASPGRHRFHRAAAAVAHLCGLILRGKRYIEQSPLVQWTILELQMQMNIRGDLLFNIRDYAKKKVQNKDFERLVHLLRICPNERTPKDILQMQLCLKTNRAFHSFPSNVQQKLCQAFIYQKYIAGTVIMKQGHMATECYLLLSGKLKFMITDEKRKNGILASEALYELEEEDFIGALECEEIVQFNVFQGFNSQRKQPH